MGTTYDFAMCYLKGGVSLIPIALDGQKGPASALLPREPDPDTGGYKPTWNPFKERFATEDEARRWWSNGHPAGLAAVCGALSGGLELIDFDKFVDEIFPRWREMVEEACPGLLERVCIIASPRNPSGLHVWFRCPSIETPGNQKLAELSEEEKRIEKEAADRERRKREYTIIETRGEGGYGLVPGCPAACHSSGRLYRHVSGVEMWALPAITAEERDALITCARYFDRSTPGVEPTPRSSETNGDLRPGDDFDRTGWDWGEILTAHGWTLAYGSPGGERRWRRPGKERGWSATTGKCHGQDGAELLRVFSSNADPFAEGKCYGKFRAFSLLNCKGDLKRAAKDLAHLGFGTRRSSVPVAPALPAESTGAAPQPSTAPVSFPAPIPASLLKSADPTLTWIVNGFLRRGEVTLLAALWKSGKTTLFAHLLRALARGGTFLGRETIAAKVLYVTEESEARWAARRDAVGIEDHVEFLIRPFATKPRVERWEEFITHVGKLIGERAYDVVIFDTLANLWPVRDENDASAVQSALMPLHGIIDKVALQLVHHTRKSDGTEATASRGSGALTGFVDTILEFRRYMPQDRKDRRRILSGYGRHEETPDELVIELTDGGYVAHGDRETVSRGDLSGVLLGFMPRTPPGMTVDQLLESWPSESSKPGRDRLTGALKDGAERSLWVQTGTGKRGSPYLFYAPLDPPETPFD